MSFFSLSRRGALVGALALALGIASTSAVLAGDDAASKPQTASPAAAEPKSAEGAATSETPKTEAPKDAAAKPETATPNPMVSVMKWLGMQVTGGKGSMCPSTKEGEAAWRAWYAGAADMPLAGLRDALVKDGWTADRTVSFFQEMAKAQGGDCPCKNGGKSEGKCEGKCRGESKGAGMAAGEGNGACKGECKGACKGECKGECKGDGDCENCPCRKAKTGAAAKPDGECCPKADGKTAP